MVLRKSGLVMLCIGCLGLFLTTHSLVRLDEPAIEQRKALLIASAEKNAKLRTIIKVAGACIGTAAAMGGIYYCLGRKKAAVSGQQISLTPTLQELTKRVEAVERPRFGTWAWCKNAANNFIFSPVTFLTLLERVTIWGFDKLGTVFYTPNLSWFMRTHTQLGVLQDQISDAGQWEKHFVPGPLAQEIIHHAAMISDSEKSPVPVDSAFHKKCLTDSMTKLIDAMTGILAFMQYKAACWQEAVPALADEQLRVLLVSLHKTRSIQVQDIVRNIYNCTNATCQSLEDVLNDAEQTSASTKHSPLTIIKGFFVELEFSLIRFKLIEQDSL